MSEPVDTESIVDVSPGRGPRTILEEVKRPLGDTYEKRHDSDCKSLHTMRGVGCKPERQNRDIKDVGRVCVLCRSAMIVEDNPGCTPGIKVFEVMSKCSSTTIVADNHRCAPVDTSDETWIVSLRNRQRPERSAVRRGASVASTMTCENSHNSEVLYIPVHGTTGNSKKDVSLPAMPSVNALLKLNEMSFAEFGNSLKAGEIAEVVVLRPEDELNSYSLSNTSVLEDTK